MSFLFKAKMLVSRTAHNEKVPYHQLTDKALPIDDHDEDTKLAKELEEVLNGKGNSKEEEKILIGGINELLETDMEHWNNAMMKAIIENITVFIDGTIKVNFKYLNSD